MFMHKRLTWFLVTAIAVACLAVLAACGGDDDEATNGDPPDQATEAVGDNADDGADDPTDAADDGGDDGGDQPDAASGESVGTITIGDETWTIVPSVQCGIFSSEDGQVVSVAGVAAEDESIKITIDYVFGDAQVQVRGVDGDPHWNGQGEEGLTFEVDGDTIRGSGPFDELISGEEAEGSFEVTC